LPMFGSFWYGARTTFQLSRFLPSVLLTLCRQHTGSRQFF